MQSQWVVIILIAAAVLVGFGISLLISKNEAQRKGSIAAFFALAIAAVVSILMMLDFPSIDTIVLSSVICLLLPIIAYLIVYFVIRKRAKSPDEKKDKKKEETVVVEAAKSDAEQPTPEVVPATESTSVEAPPLEGIEEIPVAVPQPVTEPTAVPESQPEPVVLQQEELEPFATSENALSQEQQERAALEELIRAAAQESAAKAEPQKLENEVLYYSNDAYYQEPSTQTADITEPVTEPLDQAVEEQASSEAAAPIAVSSDVAPSEEKQEPIEMDAVYFREKSAELREKLQQESVAVSSALRDMIDRTARETAEAKEEAARNAVINEVEAYKASVAENDLTEDAYEPSVFETYAYVDSSDTPIYAYDEQEELIPIEPDNFFEIGAAKVDEEVPELSIQEPSVEEVQPYADAIPTDRYFVKAQDLEGKGVFAVAAKLYEESAYGAQDDHLARQALLRAMNSYVQADRLIDAQGIAAELSAAVDKMAPEEVMAVQNVLKMTV